MPRLIDVNAIPWEEYYVPDPDSNAQWDYKKELSVIKPVIDQMPTVDAVPVDEIKLHHVIIDNEGVPEVKLQIGDRYFLLRTDPVDVREVVHGRWIVENEESIRCSECCFNRASIKMPLNYCPNCGAKMDGDGNG